MELEAILIILIIGAVAGWLAGQIVRGMGFGLIGNIVVGIVGAFIAGWLLPRIDRPGFIWMARGFGGQRLMVFPDENLIAVFTGWDILKDPPVDRELVNRILPAVRGRSCVVKP